MAALSEIEKLEARFRENPEGRYFAPLADAYRKAGRVDDALMLVQAGLERHPDYLSAHIVLGRCHLDKKDDGAALAAFQQVLTIDAENIIALKSLAEISERIGNALDARRWLMRLLTVDSMNTEAEEDLHRLGGPVEEAAAAGAPAAEPVEEAPAGFSFADVVPPEAPTEPVPAIPEALVAAMPEPEIEPEPAPAMAESPTEFLSATPGGLPLIMPEDVTPPEELTRPSAKMLQMVSPETPAEAPAEAPGEPLLTETVGDLYLKQGFRSEAAEVYRRLLAQRPDDAGLRAKLAQVETPPRLSAQALGVESVGVWLRRVARASLSARAPEVLPEPPAEGPTPMESAFSTPEPEPPPPPPAAAPDPAPAPPLTPKLGATFDEFFSGAPELESARPQPAESQAPSDHDLSAFNAWLHGLKR
jgi:tetratricopeptide (TPR) repeat protein